MPVMFGFAAPINPLLRTSYFQPVLIGCALLFCLSQATLGHGQTKASSAKPVAAWLQVASQMPQVAFSLAPNDDLDVFYQTQVELIRSPLILDLALANKSIAGLAALRSQRDPAGWLAENLKVTRRNNSELLVVTLATPNPDESAKIVNAVVDAYIKAANHARRARISEELKAIEAEIPRSVDRLAQLNRQYRETAPDDHPPAIGEELAEGDDDELESFEPGIGNGVELPVTATRDQIAALYLEMKAWEARRTDHQSNRPRTTDRLPADEIAARVEQHPDIQDLVFALDDSQRRMDTIREVSVRGVRDPKYEEVARENAAGRAALDQRRKEVRTAVVDEAWQTRLDRFEQQQLDLETQIEERRIRLRSLVRQYFEQLRSQRSTDPEVLKRRLLADQVTQAQDALHELNKRIIQLKTELNAPSRISILRGAHR